jgi:hypothetical protein
VRIDDAVIIKGNIPPRHRSIVLRFVQENRSLLTKTWKELQ